MFRSMTTRRMPKPFAILIAALLALYFVPFNALPASAATIGGFEIDGNQVDDSAEDWKDLTSAGDGVLTTLPDAGGKTNRTFATYVDNTTATGQDATTFLGVQQQGVQPAAARPWTELGSSADGNATGKSDFGRWATYNRVDDNDHVLRSYLGFDRGSASAARDRQVRVRAQPGHPDLRRQPATPTTAARATSGSSSGDQGNGTITLDGDAQNPDVGLWKWTDPDQAPDALGLDADQDGRFVKATNDVTFEAVRNRERPVAVPSWWTSGNTTAGTPQTRPGTFLEFAIDLSSFGAVLGCPSSGFTAANARSITGTERPGTLVDYFSALPISVPSSCASLFIKKFKGDGTTPLGGATFMISPNPLPARHGRATDRRLPHDLRRQRRQHDQGGAATTTTPTRRRA